MAHRYFTTHITGDTARLAGDDARHLTTVLRAKPGDAITLCDGAGTDYETVIAQAAPGEVLLHIQKSYPSPAEPTLHAEVFIGLAKGERMDYAVQKSVELGAAAIFPFESDHTVARPKNPENKTQRWQRIASEAAKQCGRGILPTVHAPLSFAGVLQKATAFDAALFCYEAGGQPLRKVLGQAARLAIITGPEGGFSLKEAQAAHRAGCVTVGLGPRILRCETAPIAVLAAVMCLSGNLE